MNTITQRLDIFLNAKMITEEEKAALEKWINIINTYSMDYQMEKLERMITHCAMMMKRVREQEEIGDLPDEIYAKLQADKHYLISLSLFDKMNAAYVIPEQEKRYLILHLCSLYGKEEQHGIE